MASLALQIDDAIAAALGAAGSPAGVDRAATIEYQHELMPAYNLAEVKAEIDAHESSIDSLARDGSFAVFCYACGSQGVTARAAVDPLIVFAEKTLQDNMLGGLVRKLDVKGYQVNYDRKSAIEVVEVQISLEVQYDTLRGDPSQNYNTTEG